MRGRLSAIALIGVAAVCALVAVGIRDADGQAHARLIVDTSAPQDLEVSAGWYSATAEEEFAAYYPATLRAQRGR